MHKIVSHSKISTLSEDRAGGPDFQSVEYRLNNRKRMSDVGANNARTFAIELNNGSMIRVTVSMEQAERFEQELASAIQQNPDADVGNLLYELTRFYDIYDMQWTGEFDDEAPMNEADDQPPADTEGGDTAVQDQDGDLAGMEGDLGNGGEGDDEGMFDDGSSVDLNDVTDEEDGETIDDMDEPSLKDVLQTMISQLQSDSEARRAEAEARKADADAKKAEAVARAMELKVGQEKELAAMEEWEDKLKAEKNKEKEMDRLAKFRLAKAKGMTESREEYHGDWGSSDWSALLNSMKKDVVRARDDGKEITQDLLRDFAYDQALFYGEMMGYRDPEDAVERIMHMWHVRNMDSRLHEKMMLENAIAPKMTKHVRDVAQAVKAKPQQNGQAFDSLQDALLDMITDVPAQKAQAQRALAQHRQNGAGADDLNTARKAAELQVQFSKRISTLRGQLQQQLQRLGKR